MKMAIEAVRVGSKRIKIIEDNKKELEKLLSVSLNFEDNTVIINGEAENVYFALPVIKAIARGFSLKDAEKLTSQDYVLEIIDLKYYCKTINCIKRLKSRVIGKDGKIKMKIQETTQSIISVYGHTVSFISPYYTAQYVREGIEMLLNGSKHSTLLRYLAKVKDKILYAQLTGKDL